MIEEYGLEPTMRGTRGTMRSRPAVGTPTSTSSTGTRHTRARTRAGAARLADGLVEVPIVEPADPASAVLTTPIVAEGRRFCGKCEKPVGRASPMGPGQPSGVCADCGAPYNFTPLLQPGDVVANQYEVQGCLTHGGLGWIYLAIDRNVSDRWVVLKGLLHSQDPMSQAVALAEREFLAELSHPSIVKIFNFVEHPRPDGGVVGYIVMEYIGGVSLKGLADGGKLSIEHAIAYVLEILPALEYMHSLGLAYNDLKPDNIMIEEDHLKIIDLGAVAGIDSYGFIYGTLGFQAPEIIETGPSQASDIYNVGRTLAVLTVGVAKKHDRYLDELPSPEDEPLFIEHEFYYRLLLRCTDPDPELRYPTARALAADLTGVLRELLAKKTGIPMPGLSTLFSPPRTSFGTNLAIASTDQLVDRNAERPLLQARTIADALPVPLVDGEDRAALQIAAAAHSQPAEALDMLRRIHDEHQRDAAADATEGRSGPPSVEIPLAEVRAYLDLHEANHALELLDQLRRDHPPNWRFDWYGGVGALLTGELNDAFTQFESVLSDLPGEQAPKLALAATAELVLDHWESDEPDEWRHLAKRYYRSLWCSDRAVVSAAFGLARQLAPLGDRAGAIEALDQVPTSSRHRDEAQMTAALLLVHNRDIATITEADLADVGRRIESLPPDERRTLQLRAMASSIALTWLRDGGAPSGAPFLGAPFLGSSFTEAGLRGTTEQTLRALARNVPNRRHRYRLVDLANRVRPRTWL
ncbi:serine/threonine-protein kinase [Tomitella biformata]|uniref:serine/threonine-protein kinase n=1 Tax=Tomitella biformata TaxID=630403 RepID=UPI0004643375|nr:serine/threonine-protein kinase [Tomitella biformata]